MMLTEIIADIRTFLALLFIAMFAFGQIWLTMKKEGTEEDVSATFSQGYVLAFGDLGEFSEYPLVKFLMFSMFTFLIPLTMMNMLIAIMSDTYARVQENAEAADTRSLAEMCHEMEVVVRIFSFKFRRSVA